MRDRLRNLDSKITFFAFADIITAVSGMLIFITLLLATDLGRPTDNRSQAADAELERQLKETLTQQAEADSKNRGLQSILTTALTAPSPDKLESDIARLRSELAQEQSKHSGLAEQLAASKSALDAQDQVLGITALRARIQENIEKLESLKREDAGVREKTEAFVKQTQDVQAKYVKLQSREGQLWLIPDRTPKSKEAFLVIVGGAGAQVERFNHPDQTQQFDKRNAHDSFESFLKKSKSTTQYFVFLIRPSGIGLFKDLVQVARDQGFEVGFDALEEGTEVHFTPAPPIDDQATTTPRAGGSSGQPPHGGSSRAPSSTPAGSTGSTGGPSGPQGSATGSPNRTGTAAAEEPGADIAKTAGTNIMASATNGITESTNTSASLTNASGSASNTVSSATNSAPSTPPPPPPKPKSWWQRFLEWIGVS
jgi:hypothetical protein